MVTYNVDVTVTDPVIQDVSVIVSESSAGVLLGGLNRQVLTKNSDADNDASWKSPGGFTYIQDTTPTPTRLGETFFDNSTGATGGFAYVAIDNGSGGLIWLQYSPGAAANLDRTVAYVQKTSNQTTITSVVDVTSPAMSVTWVANPSRRYKTSFYCNVFSSAANDGLMVLLTDASNAQITRGSVIPSVANAGVVCMGSAIETGLSGSITRKLRAQRAFGTGNMVFEAGGGIPAYLVVEDIT